MKKVGCNNNNKSHPSSIGLQSGKDFWIDLNAGNWSTTAPPKKEPVAWRKPLNSLPQTQQTSSSQLPAALSAL